MADTVASVKQPQKNNSRLFWVPQLLSQYNRTLSKALKKSLLGANKDSNFKGNNEMIKRFLCDSTLIV